MLDRVPYVGKAAVAARQEVGRAKGCPFRVVGFRATVGNPEELLEGEFFVAFVFSRGAEGALFKHRRRGTTTTRIQSPPLICVTQFFFLSHQVSGCSRFPALFVALNFSSKRFNYHVLPLCC